MIKTLNGGRFKQSVLYLPSKVPIYVDWDTLCTFNLAGSIQEFLQRPTDVLHDVCTGGRGLITVLFRIFNTHAKRGPMFIL